VVAQADGRGRLTDTQDSLFFAGQGSPINFQGPLASPIGPWVVWDATTPAPPAGFIGDPNVLHTVTGSPCGQNFFRIEGPGLPAGGLETNLFAVQGQKINICGNGFLDATEDCDRVDVAGDCCGADCK